MTLVLENVKKKYKTFELNLSMTLEPGTITGLIGRNGAGKSTTFKAILGLIKLTDGKVLIDGKQPQELKAADKENIGVVLSDSGFSGYMTVKDVIATMSVMYKKFDKADFIAKCEHFNIPLNQKMKEFSTGMKAKLKVLLAMSHGAKLLILDEPTSGLDVVVRNEILDTWLQRAREIGVESFWYKDGKKTAILDVMKRTMAGESIYPDSTPLIRIGNSTNHEFTERELDILRELTTGDSNTEIGERLCISASTVKYHVENLLAKTGFHTRTELASEARSLGIVIKEK